MWSHMLCFPAEGAAKRASAHPAGLRNQDGPTVAPWNHRPKQGLPQKNKNKIGENAKKQTLVLRALQGHRGPARMRKPSEMYTASRMQNMVQIRKKNIYFVTNLLF